MDKLKDLLYTRHMTQEKAFEGFTTRQDNKALFAGSIPSVMLRLRNPPWGLNEVLEFLPWLARRREDPLASTISA